VTFEAPVVSPEQNAKLANYIKGAGSLLELAPPAVPSRPIMPSLSRVSALGLYARGYRDLGDGFRKLLEAFPERHPSARDRCQQWLSRFRPQPMPLRPPEQWFRELWKCRREGGQAEPSPKQRLEQLIAALETCAARLRDLDRGAS